MYAPIFPCSPPPHFSGISLFAMKVCMNECAYKAGNNFELLAHQVCKHFTYSNIKDYFKRTP